MPVRKSHADSYSMLRHRSRKRCAVSRVREYSARPSARCRVHERYDSALAWEQHMNNHISLADKWERKRLRHTHQHPPLINVNQALAETLTPA